MLPTGCYRYPQVPFGRRENCNPLAMQIYRFSGWILEKINILMAPGCVLVLQENRHLMSWFGAKRQAGVLLHCGRNEKLKGSNGIRPCIKSSFSAHISILERQITLTFVLILGWSLLALDILLDLSSFLIPCLRDLLFLWVHLLSPLGKMYCFFCLLFLIIDVF